MKEPSFVGTDEGNESDVTIPCTMPILTPGTSIRYKLDTGSQVNIIQQKIFHTLQKKQKLCTAKEKLMAFDGNEIAVVGKCVVS